MADTMHIFTYGSLMFPAVWQKVVRGDYQSSAGSVHGFRRVCVRDGTHPALLIDPRAAPIVGRVYLDVNAADIARLDHFETRNYERVLVAVTIDGGPKVAQAYLAVNMTSLTDVDWSEKEFEESGLPIFLATYGVKHLPPG